MHFSSFPFFLYICSAFAQGPLTPIEGDALVAGLKDSKFNDMASLLGQIPASDLTGFLSLLTGNVTRLLPSSIPNGTVSSLLADTSKILPLLSYHVVTDTISNTTIASSPSHTIVNTALKDNATVFLQGGSAQTLVMTVEADAKIHIPNQSCVASMSTMINDLLSVPVGLTDTLKSQNITAFQSSASTSNVLDTLTGQHGVTVLVPTDTAFANANATLSRLNTTQLAGVLSSHVLNGTFYSTSLGAAQFNMAGQNLSFNGDSVSLPGGNTTKIVTSDVLTANGVMHVIDTVLLNDSLKASLKKYNASGSIRESKWTAALLSLLLCMCMIAQ